MPVADWNRWNRCRVQAHVVEVGMGVRGCAALLVAVAALGAGCGVRTETGDPRVNGGEDRVSTDVLPAGWRWESYRDVEVAVPADWGHDNGSQRVHQWCIWEGPTHPAVGRPGVSTAVGCFQGEDQVPHPSTLVDRLGTFVAFESALDPAEQQVTTEGDRTTVRFGRVEVLVQAEPALRRRIVDTIRQVSVDANGCPVSDPISRAPSRRPHPAVDVSRLSGVRAVSACKYSLQDGLDDKPLTGPTLLSSLRLEGEAAARAVAAIAAAPPGGGPDRPDQCLPEVSYGSEAIVLTVTSELGTSVIYLRYSGCDHNGFDDGINRRALTKQAVAPFITGPNIITTGFSGSGNKVDILMPGTG
jgi:hypothetical protein